MLTSCGYRMGNNSCLTSCKTIAVPYVCGDFDGLFTSELIKQLSLNGLTYTSCLSDYTLEVTLSRKDEAIGYRFERTFEDQLGKRLVATEERVTLCATFTLLDRCGRKIMGPCMVSDFLDFDFQPETSPQNQTRSSLGQLDFLKAASDAARVPVQRLLAKKLVDFLINANFCEE